MKKWLACVVLLCPPFVLANDVCELMEEFAKEANASLPSPIDQYTELTSIKVQCAGKILTYSKRIFIAAESLVPDAHELQQAGHTELHCNDKGLAKSVEWTAVDKIYDLNHKFLFTLTTTPDDCRQP